MVASKSLSALSFWAECIEYDGGTENLFIGHIFLHFWGLNRAKIRVCGDILDTWHIKEI